MDGQVNREPMNSPFVEADIQKPKRDTEDNDVLVFRLRIKKSSGSWRFRLIRDELRKAINTISELWLEDVTVEMEPDPYAFTNPDNPPKGVY